MNVGRALCTTLALIISVVSSQRHASAQSAHPSALEATLDPGEKFRDGVSLLWSPVGNAAWDALRAYHKVEKIEMSPRSATAEKLNAFVFDQTRVLPKDTLIFAADDSPEFREKVRAALRKQVGENAAKMLGPYLPPEQVQRDPPIFRLKSGLIVSSIACRPKFPAHFIPEGDARIFTDRRGKTFRTRGFGTTGKHSASFTDAVRVLEDDLAGNHVLRLACYTADEKDRQCLVLSMPGKHQYLESALMHARDLLRKERIPERAVEKDGKRWRYTDTLELNDILWTPYLQTSLMSDFRDLVGKKYSYHKIGKDEYWWQLREATQFLSIRLDHEGAMVEATFVVPPDFLSSGGGPASAQVPVAELPLYPKRFVFDRPFIASLWREGADWPYLACWVDGPELLTVVK